MEHGRERIERITSELRQHGLDALVCSLPSNVLLLSGYWPVVGTAVAVATPEGQIRLLAPEDEHDLAASGWAAELRTYRPGSLANLEGPLNAIQAPLTSLLDDLGVVRGKLGYDDGNLFEGSSYAATYRFPRGTRAMLEVVAPAATLVSSDEPIAELRSALVPFEVGRIRLACQVAAEAFATAALGIRAGLREAEVATAFAAPMEIQGLAQPDVQRSGVFTWCMSGENSASAGAAYARTQDRELCQGDFVLLHCNSYIDGYWTDITRTYCLGEPDTRQREMYEAVFAATAAALAVIAPGVRAAEVDGAAREELTRRGFGEYFTHGVGHNVGLSVISNEYPPRLHPASPDRLAVGMTFNIEPAIYIKGYGGLRHCDVVTVHEEGPELLTPFQSNLDELVVRP